VLNPDMTRKHHRNILKRAFAVCSMYTFKSKCRRQADNDDWLWWTTEHSL